MKPLVIFSRVRNCHKFLIKRNILFLAFYFTKVSTPQNLKWSINSSFLVTINKTVFYKRTKHDTLLCNPTKRTITGCDCCYETGQEDEIFIINPLATFLGRLYKYLKVYFILFLDLER